MFEDADIEGWEDESDAKHWTADKIVIEHRFD